MHTGISLEGKDLDISTGAAPQYDLYWIAVRDPDDRDNLITITMTKATFDRVAQAMKESPYVTPGLSGVSRPPVAAPAEPA